MQMTQTKTEHKAWQQPDVPPRNEQLSSQTHSSSCLRAFPTRGRSISCGDSDSRGRESSWIHSGLSHTDTLHRVSVTCGGPSDLSVWLREAPLGLQKKAITRIPSLVAIETHAVFIAFIILFYRLRGTVPRLSARCRHCVQTE